MTTLNLTDERDTLKMIRETLCVAQSSLISFLGANQEMRHIERLGRMITEIDRQRPVGVAAFQVEEAR